MPKNTRKRIWKEKPINQGISAPPAFFRCMSGRVSPEIKNETLANEFKTRLQELFEEFSLKLDTIASTR